MCATGLGLGGAEGTRTLDPHNAIVVLSQLSYSPKMENSDHSIAITGVPVVSYGIDYLCHSLTLLPGEFDLLRAQMPLFRAYTIPGSLLGWPTTPALGFVLIWFL